MKADQVRHFFDYGYWATARLLDTAASLPGDAYFRKESLAHGSLHATFAHALAAEQVWRARVQEGRSPARMSGSADFASLAELRRAWADEEKAMRSFLSGLSDAGMDREVEYSSTTKNPGEWRHPLWQILQHVANHGTQHRGEIGAELTRLGHSPGDIDYMVLIRRDKAYNFSRTWV